MASKKSKLQLDADDFGKSLDVPEFDLSFDPPKDDGKPIMKIGRALGGGFLGRLKSGDFIRRTLTTALPRGYGEMFEFADDSARSVKQLYDTAAKELKPQLNEIARVTGRLLPKDATKDGFAVKQLRKFSDTHKTPDRRSEIDPREQDIARVMGEVFNAQQESEHQREKRDQVREGLKENMEQSRHRDVLSQLDAIRQAAAKQTAYTTTVTANYHRKSLELQYRHYFVAMDTLLETRRANAEQKAYFEALVHNTALSDHAKLTGGKNKSWARNKFVNAGMSGLLGGRGRFVEDLRESFSKQLGMQARNLASGLRQGVGAADMALDAREMMQSMGGGSMAEGAAGIGGSMLAERVGSYLGKKLQPHLQNNTAVAKLGNRFIFNRDNAQSMLKNWANNGKYQGGVLGGLMDILKGTVRGMPGVDRGLHRDSLKSMQDPAVFDRSVSKSITEIIPGYLARILREIQVTRTGDTGIELTEFDLTKQRFTSRSKHRKNLKDALLPKQAREDLRYRMDNLVKSVGGETLPADVQERLSQRLLADNIAGHAPSHSRLMSERTWASGETAQHAPIIARMFRRHFKGDKTHEKETNFSTLYGTLGKYAPDQRELVQHLMNNGQEGFLRSAGALDKSGNYANVEGLLKDLAKPKTAYSSGGHVRGPGSGTSDSIRGVSLSDDEFVVRSGVVRKPGMLDFLTQLNDGGQSDDGKHFAAGGHARHRKAKSDLATAIDRNSIKPEAVAMLDLLDKIRTRLDSGVMTVGISREQWAKLKGAASPTALGAYAREFAADLPDKGRALRAAAGRGVAQGRGLFSTLRNHLTTRGQELWEKHGDEVKAHASTLRGRATTAYRGAQAKAKGLHEVWVKGETKPRLLEAKLKAGQYIDQATGGVIRKWEDIKGDIAKTGAPDKVVTYANELKDAFAKTSVGDVVLPKLGVAGKFFKDSAERPNVRERASGFFGKARDKFNALRGKGPVLSTVRDAFEETRRKHKHHTLDDIYNLFSERLPLAKKLRVGSIEDQHRRRKAKEEAEARREKKDQKDGDQAPSWMAKLGGLFSLLKGKGKDEEAGGIVDDVEAAAEQGIAGKALGVLGKGAKGAGKLGWGVAKLGGKLGLSTLGLGGSALASAGRKIPGIARGVGTAARVAKGPAKLAGRLGWGAAKLGGRLAGKTALGVGGELAAIPGRAKVLGKGLGMVGKAAKFGGKLIPGLGIAASLYGLYSGAAEAKEGHWGSALMDGGSGALGLATSIGGLGTLGAIGGGLLSGIGAVLSSPVTLPALALAGTAYGGYKLYKHLTQDNLSPLGKARFAQYGFLPTQTKYAHLIMGLEPQIQDKIVWGNGIAAIDEKKVDWKSVIESTGVDTTDHKQIHAWERWFVARFKPVFLTALSALRMVKPGAKSLSEADQLQGDDKKKYYTVARFPGGPYSELTSPIHELDALQAGPSEVKMVLDAAQADVDKAASPAAKAAAATAAAAVAAKTAKVQAQKAAAKTPTVDSTKPGSAPVVPNKAVTAVAAAAGTASGVTMPGSTSARVGCAQQGRLGALDAIRFKTYGLTALETEKVAAIIQLEKVVAPLVSVDANKTAVFKGDPKAVMAAAGSPFGVTPKGGGSEMNWNMWFVLRFLPTYLNYRTALYSVTGKDDQATVGQVLKPQDAVSIAMAVYTTSARSPDSGVQSVWMYPTSPWANYVLSDKSSAVDENLSALKKTAAKAKLAEEKAPVADAPNAKGSAAVTKPTKATVAPSLTLKPSTAAAPSSTPAPSPLTSATTGVVKDTTAGFKTLGNAIRGNPSAIDKVNAAGQAFLGAGGSMTGAGMASGSPSSAPTSGAGGKVDSLPQPNGRPGLWASVKDMITAASSMAGVDPNLMATMAAIESGFNWVVKAGTSSASGLYQFISGTWKSMLRKYGSKYGIGLDTPVSDPRANTLMGAEYLKENYKALTRVKPNPTGTDLYLAHFLGAGGATQLLKADPNADATRLMPSSAKANAPIFYENGRPRTVAQVYAEVNRRVMSRGKQFGISGGAPSALPGASAAQPKAAEGYVSKGISFGSSPDASPTTPDAAPDTGTSSGAAPTTPTGTGGAKTTVPVNAGAPGAYLGSMQNSSMSDTGGFSTQAMDASAQAKSQAKGSGSSLDDATDLLKTGNEISSKILDAITQGFASLSGKGAGGGQGQGQPQPTPTAPQGRVQSRGLPQAMPEPIVSVLRANFHFGK